MKTSAKDWTPETAMDALITLYDRYKDRPRGERLTMEVIRRLVGVRTIPTVSWWLSKKHAPQGVTLDNLCAFLDKAKDPEWLKKTITTQSTKHPKGK